MPEQHLAALLERSPPNNGLIEMGSECQMLQTLLLVEVSPKIEVLQRRWPDISDDPLVGISIELGLLQAGETHNSSDSVGLVEPAVDARCE